MDKNGNITLSYETWKNGIQTPYTGMADIVNIDIFDKPGIAKIDFKAQEVVGEEDVTDGDTDAIQCCTIRRTASSTGDAIMGTDEGDVLIVDDNATRDVTEANGTTAGDFQQAVSWKNYIIFADFNPTSDRIDLSAYSTALADDNIEYAFVSMPNDSLPYAGLGDYRHGRGALCVGIDDVLYVGSGRYVGSLTESGTFDPENGGSWTWNNQALDLPEGYEIDAMFNFNEYLMVVAGNPKTRDQQMFPWDRVSSSYNYPTPLNNGVSAQVVPSENLAYFFDGTRGIFKVTNRSTVEKITEFENIVYPKQEDGLSQKAGALALIDDVFLMGVSNDAIGTYPVGVYKIKNGVYTRQTLSEGTDGSLDNIRVHFVTPFLYNNYLVGWENATDNTFGVDEYGLNGHRATGYTAYMESPLYQVGGAVNKRSYQQLEISLAKELGTDEGVKVYYRKDINDGWTLIDTFDFDTHGAIAQRNTTAKITDVSTLQLKVEMTTGSSSATTPELLAVKLF